MMNPGKRKIDRIFPSPAEYAARLPWQICGGPGRVENGNKV